MLVYYSDLFYYFFFLQLYNQKIKDKPSFLPSSFPFSPCVSELNSWPGSPIISLVSYSLLTRVPWFGHKGNSGLIQARNEQLKLAY